jgi:glycosyltransferase involved in cell wall biosynthesis
MLKRLIPFRIKYFLWNVFKAPQRKWIGYSSLFTDLKGWTTLAFSKKKLHVVSVCVGVKNRSSNLLEFVIGSLNQCEDLNLIELSVFDCGSNDIPNLEDALKEHWKGPLIYSREEGKFARSHAFNKAILQSSFSLIMACDADISLPKDLVRKVNRYCTAKSAWFPVVTDENEDGSTRFRHEGAGIFASRKSDFIKAGKYDETITVWGKEDWLLYFEFYKNGIACIRTREPHMIHHYHPTLRPADFVPLF